MIAPFCLFPARVLPRIDWSMNTACEEGGGERKEERCPALTCVKLPVRNERTQSELYKDVI